MKERKGETERVSELTTNNEAKNNVLATTYLSAVIHVHFFTPKIFTARLVRSKSLKSKAHIINYAKPFYT